MKRLYKEYDGTNETKDDKCRVFRNYLLNTGQEELIKASMEKLKEGDIIKFRDRVVETPGLERDLLINGDRQMISKNSKINKLGLSCAKLSQA